MATNPYASGGFRKTRSGAWFSPWGTDIGVPIIAPPEFELEAQIETAMAEAEREEELARNGQLDEDDLPLEEYDAQGRPLQTGASTEKLATLTAALSALAAEPSVATTSTTATGNSASNNIALSKEKFHQKQRSKQRRRLKRTPSNAAGHQLMYS